MHDSHTHTNLSHDCPAILRDNYQASLEKGFLSGFTITDHFDVVYESIEVLSHKVDASLSQIEEVNRSFNNRLEICLGIELGEAIWNEKVTEEILKYYDFDVVYSSVHAVNIPGYTEPYSRFDFKLFSEEQINDFLKQYFTDYYKNLEIADMDVATHLTCPLRYIVGKAGRAVNLDLYEEDIERILKLVVKRDLALEVNTSCIGGNYDELMPNEKIIKKYLEFGGGKITIGSDAHKSQNMGKYFIETKEILRKLGLESGYYYKKRKPIRYKL